MVATRASRWCVDKMVLVTWSTSCWTSIMAKWVNWASWIEREAWAFAILDSGNIFREMESRWELVIVDLAQFCGCLSFHALFEQQLEQEMCIIWCHIFRNVTIGCHISRNVTYLLPHLHMPYLFLGVFSYRKGPSRLSLGSTISNWLY